MERERNPIGPEDLEGATCRGREEVVDWLNRYSDIIEHINMHHEEQWEAVLKEWGVELKW